MLEVERISKSFPVPLSLDRLLRLDLKPRPSYPALKDVSFSLEKGRILAVLGTNGAGKTTLLKILSTLVLPDQGQVIFNGYRTDKDEEKIKSLLGMVMDEERSFYWRLTGRQNLEFFACLYGLNGKVAGQKIAYWLDFFGIDYADKRFYTYSTGMKKNFALIRGLIHDPQLLLFDEPTKSLDYPCATSLRHFIKNKLVEQMGKTVIFTTHQMDEAADLANEFLVLDKGKMRGFGDLETLRGIVNEPSSDLGRVFLELTAKIKSCPKE